MTDPLAVGPGDRVTFPDVGRPTGLRGSRLLLGILVGPLVMAGYVGLTVLLFLPLLALRRMFGRRSTPSALRWHASLPIHSGVGKVWDAVT